jgi:hypothetical protein
MIGMLAQGRGADAETDMITNRHKYFRWTKRTAFITFAYAVAFPAFVGYFAYTTDVSAAFTLWTGGVGAGR